MNVGRIAELWRYPVKSMGGQKIQQAFFDSYGMIGDRAWATINTETGDVGWGKSHPELMNLQARYTEEPPTSRVYSDAVPPVTIHFPDGRETQSGGDIDALVHREGPPDGMDAHAKL